MRSGNLDQVSVYTIQSHAQNYSVGAGFFSDSRENYRFEHLITIKE